MARRIEVEVVGDSRQLERAFKRSSRAAAQFNRDLGRVGRGVAAGSGAFSTLGRSVAFASTAFLGGVGFTAAVKSSISAASNLNEQMSKSNVVFGDAAASVESWSKTTVNSMGLAQDQALETASSFGALLRPLGLTGREAANQSRRLTQLGADLASFYNTSVQDALDAIRSGLVGESEPLRRYGVLLSETRVQQEAMAETGKTNARQLTNQEKAAARVAIILRDTGQAQGDFARTSQGTANQIRIFQANVRQLQIGLGQALLPALNKTVGAMNKWFSKTKDQKGMMDDLRTSASLLADAVTVLTGVIGKYNEVREKLTSDDRTFGLGKLKFLVQSLPKIVADEVDRGRKIAAYFGLVKSDAEKARDALRAGASAAGAAADAMKFAAAGAAAVGRAMAAAPSRRAGAGGGLLGPAPPFDEQIGRRLNRLQDQSLRHQVAGLRQVAAILRDRIKEARTRRGRARLEDQLLDVTRQEKEVQQQITDKLRDQRQAAREAAKAAAEVARERARERAERLRERRETRLFGILGFGPGGEPKTPSLQQLRRQLNAMRASLANAPPRIKRQVDRIRKVLSENIVPTDVRARIREMLNGIRDELKKGVDGGTPRGFTYTGRPGVGGRSLAFAGAGALHVGTVNVYNTHNIGDLEHQLTKRQAGRAHNRRGAR